MAQVVVMLLHQYDDQHNIDFHGWKSTFYHWFPNTSVRRLKVHGIGSLPLAWRNAKDKHSLCLVKYKKMINLIKESYQGLRHAKRF
jgi:hypothetical protein